MRNDSINAYVRNVFNYNVYLIIFIGTYLNVSIFVNIYSFGCQY